MNTLPKEDLSSAQIANFLGVSRKTVTSYYEKVKQAYYWLDESELCYGASNQKRYTQFCVAAIEDLFYSDNHQKWINDIHLKNKLLNGHDNSPEPKGEIVSFASNPESSALVIPDDFTPVEIEVIEPTEVKKYDLSKFSTANLANVSNLNTNKKNTLTTLEQATAEKFRLMGKAAAQKAIHAYTAAFNEELATLTED
jgi:predicted transcriptional regulator